MKAAAVAVVAAMLLAGCSGGSGSKADVQDEVPEEIDQQRLDEVESELLSKFPRRFSFPGQQALEPLVVYINETVAQGTGSASAELPTDAGLVDANPTLVRHDVSEHVPLGQPVEMRVKLKWWGNPGSAGDLDILIDVPGTRDAYDPDSFDESNNWNIVTKFRVANTARIEGQPFDVGIQVSNGRVVLDEMRYSIRIDFTFAKDVLAPGIAYGVTLPQNASRLVFESEPVSGDEHITGEFLVIDPQDRLHRHMPYDDIGVDARVVSAPQTGEYVLYAPNLRGGFLKVSTDVPNEAFQARILPMTEHVESLVSGVMLPAGGSGSFQVDRFPLEMSAWVRPSSGLGAAAQAAMNLTSDDGWVATTVVEVAATGDAAGRIGTRASSAHDYSNLRSGAYGWTAEGSVGAGMDAGYRYLSYTR